MSWYERYESLLLWVLTTFTGAATMVVGWLVRRILTNQKQIEELKGEITLRNAQRELEMDTLRRMETDIRELRSDVKTLFAKGDLK